MAWRNGAQQILALFREWNIAFIVSLRYLYGPVSSPYDDAGIAYHLHVISAGISGVRILYEIGLLRSQHPGGDQHGYSGAVTAHGDAVVPHRPVQAFRIELQYFIDGLEIFFFCNSGSLIMTHVRARDDQGNLRVLTCIPR